MSSVCISLFEKHSLVENYSRQPLNGCFCRDLFVMETGGERTGALPSFCERTAQKFYTSPLKEEVAVDVCIIGAGIAGVTIAYFAARGNRSVVLVNDGPVGGGMTSRTTAHMVNAIDDRYIHIEKLLGGECARLTAESHTAAIDCAERIEGVEVPSS